MPETLHIPIPSERRENRYQDRPLRRLIIFLVVLGLAVVIAMTSRTTAPRPPRWSFGHLLTLFGRISSP
jgi:hypothetical protein